MLKQNLEDFEDEEQILNMEGLSKMNIMSKVCCFKILCVLLTNFFIFIKESSRK
jgi:hypothetical protein